MLKDIRDKLIPVLREAEVPGTKSSDVQSWAIRMVDECKSGLSAILPFEENEISFLEAIQTRGKLNLNI